MFPGTSTSFTVFSNRVVQDGTFDINLIYKKLKGWFEDHNYAYSELENTTNLKPKGAEIKIKMRGERLVTDYYKFTLTIAFLIVETEKVKVKDKVLDRGKLEARMDIKLDLDYTKRFGKSKFGKFIRFIYNNYLIKEEIQSEYMGKAYEEATTFLDLLKESMEMYT